MNIYKCAPGLVNPNPYPNHNSHTTPNPNHNRIIASNTSRPRPHTNLNTVCLFVFSIFSFLVLSCLGLLSSCNFVTDRAHAYGVLGL